MEVFQVATGIIIAGAATLGGLGLIFRKFRGPVQRWLGIDPEQAHPQDVKDTVDERYEELDEKLDVVLTNQTVITDNQGLILNVIAEFAGDDDPSPEDVMDALQTLAAAGFSIGDDENEEEIDDL